MPFSSSGANWAKYKSLKPNADGVVIGCRRQPLGSWSRSCSGRLTEELEGHSWRGNGMNRRSRLPGTRSYLGLILREEKGQHFSYNTAMTECLTEAIQGRKYSFGSGSQSHHRNVRHVAEAVLYHEDLEWERPETGPGSSFLILAASDLLLSARLHLLKFPEAFKIASLDGYQIPHLVPIRWWESLQVQIIMASLGSAVGR